MGGEALQQDAMFSYISAEQRVSADDPLRKLRPLVDEALKKLSRRFAACRLCDQPKEAETGRRNLWLDEDRRLDAQGEASRARASRVDVYLGGGGLQLDADSELDGADRMRSREKCVWNGKRAVIATRKGAGRRCGIPANGLKSRSKRSDVLRYCHSSAAC